jgi:hypothetical protein
MFPFLTQPALSSLMVEMVPVVEEYTTKLFDNTFSDGAGTVMISLP